MPILELLFQKEQTDYEAILSQGAPVFAISPKYLLQKFNYQLAEFLTSHPNGKLQVLGAICLTVIVSVLLKNLFTYLAMYHAATVRNGVIKDLRQKIYDKVVDLNLNYFTKQKKGDLLSRISNDIQEIEWTVLTSIEMVFKDPFAVIAYFVVLITISPKLTLFVLVVIPITGAIIGVFGSKLRRSANISQNLMGQILSFYEETISGLKIIKGFGAQNFMRNKFKRTNEDLTKNTTKLYRQKDLASPLSEFLGILVLAVVIWYGGSLILETNELSPSEFIGFIALFTQIIPHAKQIATAQINLNRGASAAERIDTVLSVKNDVVEKEGAYNPNDFKEAIKISNLSFSYEENKVLDNINLTIKKGETVALVGPSGGGKSTLTDLIARYYDPQEGTIELDNHSLKDCDLKAVRKLMGIVTQDTFLFHDTVLHNIKFNQEDLSEEDVVNAAKVANADTFIQDLEKGYQTIIGDRGTKLSGGQRQRISIARAVLKDPSILILDEATSALDTESERLVQEALDKMMQNRTSIVIAHRLSTIKNADKIVVIDSGKIVEQGTHNELLQENGVYKKLYDLQSFS